MKEEEFLENFLAGGEHNEMANDTAREMISKIEGKHTDVALKAVIIMLRVSFDSWFKNMNPNKTFGDFVEMLSALGEMMDVRGGGDERL